MKVKSYLSFFSSSRGLIKHKERVVAISNLQPIAQKPTWQAGLEIDVWSQVWAVWALRMSTQYTKQMFSSEQLN